MACKIVKYEPEHAKRIIDSNLRVQEDWVKEADIAGLISQYCGEFAFTAIAYNDPIACAGVSIGPWNVGNAWALLSSKFYRHKLSIYRAMKYGLETCIADHKLQRVQAFIDPFHQEAVDFIECFGFEYEGRMRKSGPNGMDYLVYARVV
jgi:RimJ/RimL family protein N-acetyltransferase